ncbi:Polysaccharide biosynthesis protein [Candidatus Methanoperedens nitroreducens]|uniref:Polysaccharide biosynthesis protein n=1 Tax=Candidatus Methanoperedens nitratireducens TaxID=1392998 RepID=A0A062UZ31_9EURY|nr:hypothetical protein [Candidatus Methanoperedens nitroreducens]KCZ72191.1 Polysaccharide biosynthesis protein [Candidatus Methanoperedens nitroreducens]MDJ1421832.1 hypothetical protein [Candidatus Methanoperedens sp.]
MRHGEHDTDERRWLQDQNLPHVLKAILPDPLYRNSIAMILNSAFGAFFGLLFWIVAARTMSSKDIGLATAAISAAALIVGLSRLGLDAGLVKYLPELL